MYLGLRPLDLIFVTRLFCGTLKTPFVFTASNKYIFVNHYPVFVSAIQSSFSLNMILSAYCLLSVHQYSGNVTIMRIYCVEMQVNGH